MPKKMRELKAMLKKAGFHMLPGKGSHTNWFHAKFKGRITLSGTDGADAQRYHERRVETAIEEVRKPL